jgi:hypothetical protein
MGLRPHREENPMTTTKVVSRIEIYHIAIGEGELLFVPGVMLHVIKDGFKPLEDYPVGERHPICSQSVADLMEFTYHCLNADEPLAKEADIKCNILGVTVWNHPDSGVIPPQTIMGTFCKECEEYLQKFIETNNPFWFSDDRCIGHCSST